MDAPTASDVASIFNSDSASSAAAAATLANDINRIASYIPPYVTPGSWLPWNRTAPCPAGYTCTSMGNVSLGAFSCDEMARIALEEFGFGDVLAGTYCPEGEMGVLNCDVGGYCPDSTTRIDCPAGMYCQHKTSQPTFEGGAVDCDRCSAGAQHKRLSKSQRIVQIILFVILCLLVIMKAIRRKVSIDQEKLKKKLNIDSLTRNHNNRRNKTEVSREQEKYKRLRPKLEVIASRLSKLRQGQDASQHSEAAQDQCNTPTSLSKRNSILYLSDHGNIIFDANELYDALDTNNDGLSLSEINSVLCLNDAQLNAFITNMRARVPGSAQAGDKISRVVFVKHFLDVLADASMLTPTREEAEDLFDSIAEEVGETDDGDILYEELYGSMLSSFLSDLQIYGLIKRFKQRKEGRSLRRLTMSLMEAIHGEEEGSISKSDFGKYYPIFLGEVTRPDFMSNRSLGEGGDIGKPEFESGGLDVAFEDLCLTVNVAGKQVNVVDHVTGRLRSNTMTALMGGSGCGKSSLLNALCGRAFYGTVKGSVKINGNDSKIEDHKAVIGFVPQDDIVYPDLTVRENLLYSGRLQLPAGTTKKEIEELADTTMAQLGLSRIANSLVGDATRRGISGGEKKRVNIGLELMKRPKILFLDEPTSGLDSRSAFVVMESLQRLINTQGMTVAAVIHQPRTDIYDMFDSLFLLGVGGRTVYHGPATETRSYFESLSYEMKHGESQADWFLDISSGDVESGDVKDIEEKASMDVIDEHKRSSNSSFAKAHGVRFEVVLRKKSLADIGFVLVQPNGGKKGEFVVSEVGHVQYATASGRNVIQPGDKVIGINGRGVSNLRLEDINSLLTEENGDTTVFIELSHQIGRCTESERASHFDNEKMFLISGPAGKEEALAKARDAREKLYRQFQTHFENMPASRKAEFYDSPKAFALPNQPNAVSSTEQFLVQLRRNCLLSWRNRDSKIIDLGVFLIAVFAMTLLGGVQPSNWLDNPEQLMWLMFIASPEDASTMLQPVIFRYAIKGVNAICNYAMMVGLILSVLTGLNATKVLTERRLEFFREAQSGTSVTAYYLAASLTATIEQGFSAVVGSALAFLVLKPSTTYLVYLWNFFMLSWLSVSWAVLLAIIVPINSVSTVVGFFNAFFGLLFCGKVQPGLYQNLYSNDVLAVFSAFVSPLRFFVEGIAVSEAKCLPNQSGYTVASNAFSYPEFEESYPYSNQLTYMARTDPNTAITQSCDGWFWWVGPAFVIGLTIRLAGLVAIHFSDRSKQGKKSLKAEMMNDCSQCGEGAKPIYQSFIFIGTSTLILFGGLLALSCWLVLRENEEQNQFERY